MTLEVIMGGSLMNKDHDEAYAFINDMAQNHYRWRNKYAPIKEAPERRII